MDNLLKLPQNEINELLQYQNPIVYDIETTGLYPDSDEILSLSIIDLHGKILFQHFFKPSRNKSWPSAERITGISPNMVNKEKPISYYKKEIQEIFENADLLITYNGIGFDDNFLRAADVIIPKATTKFDVMLHYAELVGEWDDYHKGWKWHKLVDCAKYYGYIYHAHDSLEDVKATAYCFYCMIGHK